ncbi:hypothetical protein BDK51DRAFT_27878 [Blyttiomyces helicus]|uniref:Uncharacterized protein n=1 Tax=Blyttiomyces helicus TaxID=388810 RepID=A0A4P9WKG3_9FUNG|nr:hypothetical protein BDK51DRAFT_27878 [Blyttiomyces helicus]|eukprot:RKO93304.1 hypothetical protein BDK51DRAFT_27878 [Blyttiomyces helicus]
MAALSNLISTWIKNGNPSIVVGDVNKEKTFRELFNQVLHRSPFYLRYSLDRKRPDLFLIHPTELSDMSDPVVLECNGIILRKKTHEIVARGMDNICDVDIDQAMSYLDTPDTYALEEAEDGTVLRVSYIDDQWVVSTNRCIDATHFSVKRFPKKHYAAFAAADSHDSKFLKSK